MVRNGFVARLGNDDSVALRWRRLFLRLCTYGRRSTPEEEKCGHDDDAAHRNYTTPNGGRPQPFSTRCFVTGLRWPHFSVCRSKDIQSEKQKRAGDDKFVACVKAAALKTRVFVGKSALNPRARRLREPEATT